MDALKEILLGVGLFVGIDLCIVGFVRLARRKLVPAEIVTLTINGTRAVEVHSGVTLLEALADCEVTLPAACGGKGTCGQCRVTLESGGGSAGPGEVAVLGAVVTRSGARLACQVRLDGPLAVRVPTGLPGIRRIQCVVRTNRSVATFMKELVLELPPGETFAHRAGSFVQISCPPYEAEFRDFAIPPRYLPDWERQGLLGLKAGTARRASRAYSLANRPSESDVLVLVVRIATPPPHVPDAPPGVVSSWIFQLEPGDVVPVAGPFGHFFAEESEREMILVGGGAGMAPMRSHVFDQLERLHARRKITFWYGARSLRELFYEEDFDALAAEHENFAWHVALSDPLPEDEWNGPVGFIHQVLFEDYLKSHPDPGAAEYYLCGPPLMIRATRKLLAELGVQDADVHFDDFGGGS